MAGAEARNERLRVAPALELCAPEGGVLQIFDVALEFRFEGLLLDDVWLCFTVPLGSWDRIDGQCLFHLAPEVRGPVFAGGFNVEPAIEIEARIDRRQLSGLASLDPLDIAARLLESGLDDPLRATESWYALYVKQQRGGIKTGLQTSWVR